MKLAGVMATRNYPRFPGPFPVLSAMTDVTLVLDDGSDSDFPYKENATEYLYLKRSGAWNDAANRTLLLYRAFVNKCEWVLQCDDDMLPSMTVFRRVRTLLHPDVDVVYVACRDLWNDIEHYRVDGIWGQKDYPLLIRNWFCDERITVPFPARLHKPPLPSHRERVAVKAPPEFSVYHLGSLSSEARQARVAKYSAEDATHAFQDDYTYLANEEGLVRANVPLEDHAALHQWMRH